MDLTFSDGDIHFREEIRAWLETHAPREQRPHDRRAMREFDLAWQQTQWKGGWAGISWAERYGGRGLSRVQQLIWHEEYGRLGLPGIDACFVGLSHAAPTLMARATDEQKAFHLPKILRGDVVWCQGFSEPDAGSDLASLQTRALSRSVVGRQRSNETLSASTCSACPADIADVALRALRP
jgi:alkylation response protein AidB-like acyl-CoA dehydrogenase